MKEEDYQAAKQRLFNRAKLGVQAEQFFDTPLGRRIIDMANKETDECLLQLADVDPTDHKKIAKIQNDYNSPSRAITWLALIISDGQAAELELSQMEDNQFEDHSLIVN